MNDRKRCNTFGRELRLSGRAAFSAIFDARVRTSKGALTAYARPNGLAHWRLGISIGRKAGNAPRRNRIKRMLREAFRLNCRQWPGAYDLVVVARGHEPPALEEYERTLTGLSTRLHGAWVRKADAGASEAPATTNPGGQP